MFRYRRTIYLDNNATTEVSKKVVKKMHEVLKNNYANPSSLYKISHSAAILLDESREAVANVINARKEEITFTGSATEANNTILKSLFEQHYPVKNKIISTPIEHPSVRTTLEYLESKGADIVYLKVDERGQVSPEELKNEIDGKTILVSCMFVNNEIGSILPIPELAKICNENSVPIMVDCVQAFGKVSIDVKKLGIDYASFSAHKIRGPKGIGALFVKTGNEITPLVHGGHQENGLRAGTEGVHNIAGFAEAAKDISALLLNNDKLDSLRNMFINGIKNIFPSAVINTDTKTSVPNTLSVTFPGINNALLLAALDFRGIAVSAGSACNTQENTPSHVLKSIGLSDKSTQETLRFSLPGNITQKDIKYVLEALKECLNENDESIKMLNPSQFDESMLFHDETYILDIRFDYDRISIKGMPNSHEASFWRVNKYLNLIPQNKNIVVICQTGVNSPLVAYYLRKKNFKNLNFIMGGMLGWKLAHPNLYKKYAGQNIERLKLR